MTNWLGTQLMNQSCPRANRPAHTVKAKVPAPVEPAPSYSSQPKLIDETSNERRIGRRTRSNVKKRRRRQEKARRHSVPATSTSKNRPADGVWKNRSHITCFQPNEKGHYAPVLATSAPTPKASAKAIWNRAP